MTIVFGYPGAAPPPMPAQAAAGTGLLHRWALPRGQPGGDAGLDGPDDRGLQSHAPVLFAGGAVTRLSIQDRPGGGGFTQDDLSSSHGFPIIPVQTDGVLSLTVKGEKKALGFEFLS